MKPSNLLSIYQGGQALASLGKAAEHRYKVLKSHELATMRAFCDSLKAEGCTVADLDGFFAGYAIDRISKEFDLLRFGCDCIVNIELKAPLRRANKEEKILRQMRTNHHYLSFLGRPLHLFTYVDKDGFYAYCPDTHSLRPSSAAEIAALLHRQTLDENADPDQLFVPSNYLISPFADTERFLQGEYFLTTTQQSVKDDVFRTLRHQPGTCFLLSAAAGTGKTLLLYDIIKSVRAQGGSAALLHTAPLSKSQLYFRCRLGWAIHSLSDVHPAPLCSRFPLLLIDDAQHLSSADLDALAHAAQTSGTTLLLAYEAIPELHLDPAASSRVLLSAHYPELPLRSTALSAKIRINSALSAFISNLFHIGAVPLHNTSDCVSLDYLYEAADLRAYASHLTSHGWTLLTNAAAGPGFSLADCDAIDLRHAAGREHNRVAVILDRRFFYDPAGHLQTTDQTSAALRALYRIVTRTNDQLKLILYNNPPLYLALLKMLEEN